MQNLLSGEMVIPSQSLCTLVTNDEWYAVGNFRETQLKAIKVGDCATAYSLIDRSKPIKAVVQGIGAGVLDTDGRPVQGASWRAPRVYSR